MEPPRLRGRRGGEGRVSWLAGGWCMAACQPCLLFVFNPLPFLCNSSPSPTFKPYPPPCRTQTTLAT